MFWLGTEPSTPKRARMDQNARQISEGRSKYHTDLPTSSRIHSSFQTIEQVDPFKQQNQPSHHWTTMSEFRRHKVDNDKPQPLHSPRTHLQPRHSRLQLASASYKRHTHMLMLTNMCTAWGWYCHLQTTDIISDRLLGDDQVPTSEETSIHQSFATVIEIQWSHSNQAPHTFETTQQRHQLISIPCIVVVSKFDDASIDTQQAMHFIFDAFLTIIELPYWRRHFKDNGVNEWMPSNQVIMEMPAHQNAKYSTICTIWDFKSTYYPFGLSSILYQSLFKDGSANDDPLL